MDWDLWTLFGTLFWRPPMVQFVATHVQSGQDPLRTWSDWTHLGYPGPLKSMVFSPIGMYPWAEQLFPHILDQTQVTIALIGPIRGYPK